MSKSNITTGGCMCGETRFEAKGEPIDIAYCHCSDCRGYTGAPVVTWIAFDAQNVQFLKGERKKFESSPGIHWGFCPSCGTSLTWEGNSVTYSGNPIVEVHASTLDDPNEHIPTKHWFDSERLPWFDIADNLPRFHRLDVDTEATHQGPRK